MAAAVWLITSPTAPRGPRHRGPHLAPRHRQNTDLIRRDDDGDLASLLGRAPDPIDAAMARHGLGRRRDRRRVVTDVEMARPAAVRRLTRLPPPSGRTAPMAPGRVPRYRPADVAGSVPSGKTSSGAIEAISTGFLDRPDASIAPTWRSLGPRPGVGRVRRSGRRRHVPQLGRTADRTRLWGDPGLERDRGHGPTHSSPPRHSQPARRHRACRRPGAGRDRRHPVLHRVPDLRPPRLRAGNDHGHLVGRPPLDRPRGRDARHRQRRAGPGRCAMATARTSTSGGASGSPARRGAVRSRGATTSASPATCGATVGRASWRSIVTARAYGRTSATAASSGSSASHATCRGQRPRLSRAVEEALWRYLASIDLVATIRPTTLGRRPRRGC